jgi:hypothetical protein
MIDLDRENGIKQLKLTKLQISDIASKCGGGEITNGE